VAIDVKALLADTEFFYRNGADIDGMTPAALATLMVAQAAIGTAATLDFDTDDTMAADSDTRVPTQAAVVAYVAAEGGGVGNISDTDTDVTGWDFILDEDDLVSDSATKLPTQQSVKAYVDALPTLTTSDTVKVPIATVGGVTTLDVSGLAETGSTGFLDSAFTIEDETTGFEMAFQLSGLSENRTYTAPDSGGTLVTTLSTDAIPVRKRFAGGLAASFLSFFGADDSAPSYLSDARNQTIEIGQNATRPNGLGFVHHSGILTDETQSASGAIIATITARGHTGSPANHTGYASGNQLRLLGITTEAVQDSSRGAYWQFYTTATGGSSNRAVFRIFETGAFGYPDAAGSGVGGTVTQGAGSGKSTAVTLNTPTGQITMNNANLTATTTVGFTLNNTCIEATDTVIINLSSGGTTNSYYVGVDAVAANSCHIIVRNFTAGGLAEALVLNYTLIKGANA
jgi:hypothetical protein